MKSLHDYILNEFIKESKKEESYKDIYNRCEKIQGKCSEKEARKFMKDMGDFFEQHTEYSLEDFKKDRKDESFYLIFDNDNMLMCFWDFNKFKSSTVQIDGNDAWVNGNLYYQSGEIDNFIKNHIKKPTIWKAQ